MSEPSQTDERDALKALIASEGWQQFCAYIDRNWGDAACFQRIERALGDSADPDLASMTTQQIRTTAKAVREMVQWPTQRVQQLAGEKDGRTFARWRRA